MDYILLEVIESDKFGKVAHFVRETESFYSRIVEDKENDTVIYEELTEEETNELLKDAGIA